MLLLLWYAKILVARSIMHTCDKQCRCHPKLKNTSPAECIVKQALNREMQVALRGAKDKRIVFEPPAKLAGIVATFSAVRPRHFFIPQGHKFRLNSQAVQLSFNHGRPALSGHA